MIRGETMIYLSNKCFGNQAKFDIEVHPFCKKLPFLKCQSKMTKI